MSATLLTSDSRTNATEFTVSEISAALKRTVEDAFGNVRVRGEISGYRGPHSSGHAYFALKDDRARIEAVVWKGTMGRLKFRPEEGMEVIATGRLTTYPGSSKYQIVIDNLEPAGAGALMALLEDRKRRLQAEGLFDPARKQLLPFMPRVIGVITSPTGAVIRDIIHRIKDRFPLHVLVWPVRVQGDTCGAEVTAAVQGFNQIPVDGRVPRPDVLIVARGGGSLEDLWGFNDEALARAVAGSDIPVVSAVGHETDWTLIDFVADVRAPTPTGAAEMAVPVRAELEATLSSLGARLRACVSRGLERRRQATRAASRALPSPDQVLALPRRRFDEAAARLERSLETSVEGKCARFRAARLTPAALEQRLVAARKRFEREGEQLGKCGRAYLRRRRQEWEKKTALLTPTPLVRRLQEARRRLAREGDQLGKCDQAYLRRRRSELQQVFARLRIEPVARHARQSSDRLLAAVRRAERAVGHRLARSRDQLARSDRLLATLSYQGVLARGFVVVTDAEGSLLKRTADVTPGTELALRFADGTVGAVAKGEPAKPKPRAAEKPAITGRQGSLF